jgi:hypothetical protein
MENEKKKSENNMEITYLIIGKQNRRCSAGGKKSRVGTGTGMQWNAIIYNYN